MPDLDVRILRRLLKQAIETIAPDLRKTMAPPRLAVVTAVKPAGGTYFCSVKPVLNDRRDDPDSPVIPDVEIPVIWAGPDRGVVCPPVVGEFCVVGFYDGDPNCPYISSFRPGSAPAAELDSFMIQHSPGIRLGFRPDGAVIIEAPNIEAVATGHIKATAATAEVTAEKSASVTAGTEIGLTAPVIKLEGRVEVTGGIYGRPGQGGSGFEMRGDIRIIEGGLEAQGDVVSSGNMKAGGKVEAGGDVKSGGEVIDGHGHTFTKHPCTQ